MGLLNGIFGKLLGAKYSGEANPNAGATPNFDDEGNIVDYTDQDGNKLDKKSVDKTGTGALKRPSAGMALFNQAEANRVNAINDSYNAFSNEDKQKFNTEQNHLKDIISNSGLVKDEDVDKLAAMLGTRAISSGVSPQEIENITRGKTELAGGLPQTQGETNVEVAKQNQRQAISRGVYGVPEQLAEQESEQAKAATAIAKSKQRVLPYQEEAEKTGSQVQSGLNTGALGRMDITNKLLDSDTVNRLAKSTDVDPMELQLTARDLQEKLNRQPTEQELERQVLANKLTGQSLLSKEYELQGGELGAQKEVAGLTQQTIKNRAVMGALESAQPPQDVRSSLRLYGNPDINAAEKGVYRKALTLTPGTNPYVEFPALRNIEMANQMSGGGHPQQGQPIRLPSGRIVTMGPSGPLASAPVTSNTQAPAAPAQSPTPSYSPQTVKFISDAQNSLGRNFDDGKMIKTLGSNIAARVGVAAGNPALQIGSSSLFSDPSYPFERALKGKSNSLGLTQKAIFDYIGGLPIEDQSDIYQKALTAGQQTQ